MLLQYKGENTIDFINDSVYEAKKVNDDAFGDYYAIFDEGDDWYCYSIKFVEKNFLDVTSELENNEKSA